MAKKQKPSVLIALTGQRMIFTRTAACLIEIARRKDDYDAGFHVEMGCEIASMRNRIVQSAKDKGVSHLLFVDYDMAFPGDVVSKLLAQDKDIIGAAYNFRKDPPQSTAIPVVEPAPTDAPYKCQTLGTGMLLIKMSVFETMPAPWFLFGYKEDGTLLYGEDTYFCQHAINKFGLEVWADPSLGVQHIGEQLF